MNDPVVIVRIDKMEADNLLNKGWCIMSRQNPNQPMQEIDENNKDSDDYVYCIEDDLEVWVHTKKDYINLAEVLFGDKI